MLREAELFGQAEQVLVEVVGRVHGDRWRIALPPLLDRPGDDQPVPLRAAVASYVRENAQLPDRLAGRTPDTIGPDEMGSAGLGDDPQAAVVEYSAAALAVGPGSVLRRGQPVSTADYLLELTIARAFLAHEIAMQLGSRASR